MIYIGRVKSVVGKKLIVTIPSLGGSSGAIGPLEAVAPVVEKLTGLTSTTEGHSHSLPKVDLVAGYYKKGDRVVVAQVGVIKENLVVVGKIA